MIATDHELIGARHRGSDWVAHAPSRVGIGALADSVPLRQFRWDESGSCRRVFGEGAKHRTRGRVRYPASLAGAFVGRLTP